MGITKEKPAQFKLLQGLTPADGEILGAKSAPTSRDYEHCIECIEAHANDNIFVSKMN